LILNTQLSAKKKCKQQEHLQYQCLDIASELLTGIKNKYKNWADKQGKF